MGFYTSEGDRALQDIEDWHDNEGHGGALDLCRHPACDAFSRMASFRNRREVSMKNMKAARDLQGQHLTSPVARNEIRLQQQGLLVKDNFKIRTAESLAGRPVESTQPL